MKQLIIADKKACAAAIANAVSADIRKNGYLMNDKYIVTWCVGTHIGYADPEYYDIKYKGKWSLNMLPIIPDVWKLTLNNFGSGQFDIIRQLINDDDVGEVICAADFSREGEVAFRNMYAAIKSSKPVKRLWLNALDDTSIISAIEDPDMQSKYDDLYLAGVCRAKLDWLIGINGTRLVSIKGGSFNSIGRVQTLVLKILADKEKEIADFVPSSFYQIVFDLDGLKVCSQKIKDRSQADALMECVLRNGVKLKSVESSVMSVKPPKLFDLASLQVVADRVYGYTAMQTQNYAQSLYESQYITYPKTDCRYITENMLDNFADGIDYSCDIFNVDNDHFNVVRCVGEPFAGHSAIVITEKARENALSDLPKGERSILMLIASRMLLASSDDRSYQHIEFKFECDNTEFSAVYDNIYDHGWKRIESMAHSVLFNKSCEYDKRSSYIDPDKYSIGESFTVKNAEIIESNETPPARFSDGTIIQAMKYTGSDKQHGRGIGTSATRAGMIEKLIKQGCAERVSGKMFLTDKGSSLLKTVPDVLLDSSIAAHWELLLQDVDSGLLGEDSFMLQAQSFVRKFVNENKYSKCAPQKVSLGMCPKCGGNVFEGKSVFYCNNSVGKNSSCSFFIKKDEKFFLWKRKKVTAELVTALLKTGKIKMHDMYSERTNDYYDGIVTMDTSKEYVSFSVRSIQNE